MPLDHIPPRLAEWLIGSGAILGASILGRLMYHARQVQIGRRRFLSAHLLWELPVAIGTGIIGQGIAAHFGLSGMQETACIVTIAYLGPGFIEGVVWRLIDRYAPRKGEAKGP